jgi:glycosyltransferase involved in cell wall biosynthesis
MRILFVQPYITFPGVMNDTLPGQLARKGHKVLIATYSRTDLPHSSIPNLAFMRAEGLSASVPNFVSEFPYLLNLGDMAKAFDPDIVHANNLPFLTTWQAANLAKNLKEGGVVVQVHGVLGERSPLFNAAQKLFIRTFGPSIFGSVDRLFCLNRYDASEVQRYGAPSSKIRIIPNGVDVEKFKPGDGREVKTLLWSGRFVSQKGLQYLIKAIEILVKARGLAGLRLFLTGDGPLLTRTQHMVNQLGLEGNVTILGRVSREEVAERMRTCQIFALPSINEGLPYALLEAMSSGMAVVASGLPGISSVVTNGKDGLLVPPKDPLMLAESIERLLNDETFRAALSKNARVLMANRYDWALITEMVERQYRDILARS